MQVGEISFHFLTVGSGGELVEECLHNYGASRLTSLAAGGASLGMGPPQSDSSFVRQYAHVQGEKVVGVPGSPGENGTLSMGRSTEYVCNHEDMQYKEMKMRRPEQRPLEKEREKKKEERVFRGGGWRGPAQASPFRGKKDVVDVAASIEGVVERHRMGAEQGTEVNEKDKRLRRRFQEEKGVRGSVRNPDQDEDAMGIEPLATLSYWLWEDRVIVKVEEDGGQVDDPKVCSLLRPYACVFKRGGLLLRMRRILGRWII